ncbi:hypothetical protein ACIRD7_35010, partial [Streptomyces sp. NPDC093568]
MSGSWPRWSASRHPTTLIQYVQRAQSGTSRGHGAPSDFLGTEMPAPSDTSPGVRAQALYEAFARRGITYADEPATSEPGRQTIRPPYEILAAPRHATCVDLAIAYAGACLDAGLHPVLIVLAGALPEQPAHALVAVWLGGSWSNRAQRDYRTDEDAPRWDTLPPDFTDLLADTADSTTGYLAVDITGASSRSDAGDPLRRDRHSWEEAVAHGTRLLQEADPDRWTLTIDVGLGYPDSDPHTLPDEPSTDVLKEPYLPVPASDESDGDGDLGEDAGEGPGANSLLQLLWARHDIIRFQSRDELDYLSHWFTAPDPAGPRTRIALIHGVGGCGKTRLAAQLADQFARSGWYAGFLVGSPDPHDLAWLSTVASPLLVVVDYAEDRPSADVISLLRLLRPRTEPTCVLLTARTMGSWWKHDIVNSLKNDGHRYTLRALPLPDRHPRQTGVYRAALRAFAGAGAPLAGSPPPDPHSGRWTTLDLVMHAWLDSRRPANDDEQRPTSENSLYTKVLDHELGYWTRAYEARHPGEVSDRTEQLLREAGACLSLLMPQAERLDEVLSTVKDLGRDSARRDKFAALLSKLLPVAPEDGTLAVRPDPLGTHLASTVFATDRELFRRCLKSADKEEQLNLCIGVSRLATASDGSASAAAEMAHTTLEEAPEVWRTALSIAAAQGGPFLHALEQLAEADDTPLPLAELSTSLPLGHSTLRRLALIATERVAPGKDDGSSEPARAARAAWLNNLAVRQAETGDHQGALASVTEAVTLYRDLAQGPNGPAFLPHLATSLNNLANQQSKTGNRQGALTPITEAVTLYRDLAQGPNGPAFLPHLAMSLNNLAVQQSKTGNRQGALTSITEAVTLYRDLAHGPNGPAFLPHLAMSLNNLAVRQSETGDHQSALTSV